MHKFEEINQAEIAASLNSELSYLFNFKHKVPILILGYNNANDGEQTKDEFMKLSDFITKSPELLINQSNKNLLRGIGHRFIHYPDPRNLYPDQYSFGLLALFLNQLNLNILPHEFFLKDVSDDLIKTYMEKSLKDEWSWFTKDPCKISTFVNYFKGEVEESMDSSSYNSNEPSINESEDATNQNIVLDALIERVTRDDIIHETRGYNLLEKFAALRKVRTSLPLLLNKEPYGSQIVGQEVNSKSQLLGPLYVKKTNFPKKKT